MSSSYKWMRIFWFRFSYIFCMLFRNYGHPRSVSVRVLGLLFVLACMFSPGCRELSFSTSAVDCLKDSFRKWTIICKWHIELTLHLLGFGIIWSRCYQGFTLLYREVDIRDVKNSFLMKIDCCLLKIDFSWLWFCGVIVTVGCSNILGCCEVWCGCRGRRWRCRPTNRLDTPPAHAASYTPLYSPQDKTTALLIDASWPANTYTLMGGQHPSPSPPVKQIYHQNIQSATQSVGRAGESGV